ncbi:MobA/MobL family protein [Salmonella enterica]|nr:MobA/MobL family protein [Salmonella enterica]
MAIFHQNFKILTRTTKDGKSKSSLYLAAYNNRERLTDELTGQTFDYTKKDDLYVNGIILPDGAPEHFRDRSALWNAAEKAEKRKDSQICRYFIVALPKELDGEQNEELLQQYIKKNFVKKGMCADYAIHDVNSKNPHAHVMLTMREVNANGFCAKKSRDWNKKENLEIWRRSWAVSVNSTLRKNGHTNTITNLSHLTRKELYINRANDELQKGNLKTAEMLIQGVNQLNNKPPKKRKPRHEYIQYKKQKTKNRARRQQMRQQIAEAEKNKKKESKLNLLFKKLLLKLKIGSKSKKPENMVSEEDFLKNQKPDEYAGETKQLKNEVINYGETNKQPKNKGYNFNNVHTNECSVPKPRR